MKVSGRVVSCVALGAAMLAASAARAQQSSPAPSDTSIAQPPASAEQPQAPRQAQGETPAATAPVQAAAQSTSSNGGIGDTIVTATRRETSLQRTPQAISVVNGPALQLQGRTGLDDLKQAVPNVNFAATSNVTQLYIRGIGNTFIAAGGDPGVALYQDSAYISDQTTSNTGFFDIERVEVLRGPQGALYGRNATGGAISVISARPTTDLQGQVSVTAGDYGRGGQRGLHLRPARLREHGRAAVISDASSRRVYPQRRPDRSSSA